MVETITERSWDVLLIGGGSGVGKTSVSYPIARRFGIALTEADDLFVAIEAITTPEQQPLLHFWRTNPEAPNLSAEEILEHHIAVCHAMAPAMRAVIKNHLETNMPVVIEGDYFLPDILSGATDRVKGIFLDEPDEGQIRRNLLTREPDIDFPEQRARVSWLLCQRIREQCKDYDLPTIECRPWETVVERVIAAVA
jgi:2-phosphoglycerate kinase